MRYSEIAQLCQGYHSCGTRTNRKTCRMNAKSCARWWPKSKQQGGVRTMKQTTRKKKRVKVFGDLKQ
jgi:hypothetical protein